VSIDAAAPNRRFVVVMPTDGGPVREFLIPTTSWGNQQTPYDLRWFGDGRGLGFSGRDTRGAPAVFRLRLDTGEWDTIPLSEREVLTRTEWNHDGTAFYFARWTRGEPDEGDAGIFQRTVDGEAERLVYRATPRSAMYALQLSPDRNWLAFHQETFEADRTTGRIVVVDVGTGESRTVLIGPDADVNDIDLGIRLVGWTPSGDLLMQRRAGTGDVALEILLVPLDGGTPRPFALASIGPTSPRDTSRWLDAAQWSPDGRTMVLGRTSRGGETFVIEHPLAAMRPATTSR
jgi:hypothetical protein